MGCIFHDNKIMSHVAVNRPLNFYLYAGRNGNEDDYRLHGNEREIVVRNWRIFIFLDQCGRIETERLYDQCVERLRARVDTSDTVKIALC